MPRAALQTVEERGDEKNPALIGTLAHGYENARACDRADTASRLEKSEACGADEKHVARQDRQQCMVQSEDRGKRFHHGDAENDRLRDDVSKSRLGFGKKIMASLLSR